MASSKISKISSVIRGEYRPTVLNGASSISFDNSIHYTKIGPIVVLSHAFWSFTIAGANSNTLDLSLPFKPNMPRFIGYFGYNNSGKNYLPVVSINQDYYGMRYLVKNSDGSVEDVKGNTFTSFIGQMSIVYTTDE